MRKISIPASYLPLFLIALLPCAAHAQAPGVEIIEQSDEGLEAQDDALRKIIAELDKQGKLLPHETISEQMKQPLKSPLNLPTPSTQKLTPNQVAQHARASAVRVGWTYLCQRCGDWHLDLAGGYAITADGAIATCAHVIETPDMKRGSLIVVDYDGNIFPVTGMLQYDPDMDAAVVKIDKTCIPLPLNDQVGPGDAAFCYSEPFDQRGYFSRGMVNRFFWDQPDRGEDDTSLRALRSLRLNVSTPWAPGSSGSPVLDDCGNAIGHVALIKPIGDGSMDKKPRRPKAKATFSDIEEAIPLITLHTAIPARSVRALCLNTKP